MRPITLVYVTPISANGLLEEAVLDSYYFHSAEGKPTDCQRVCGYTTDAHVDWQIRVDEDGSSHVVRVSVEADPPRDVSLVKDDFLGICELAQMDARLILLRTDDHVRYMKLEYCQPV